ncbi:unnamed protein product [Cuscuta europaea]|uniref:Uncharacterized protein n=1 Tax=Cuscuta europaea TaxID=41803 RepID=A0A9P0YUC7_CUSEU|nr:unnamed protein product [Cuscuta europaea]
MRKEGRKCLEAKCDRKGGPSPILLMNKPKWLFSIIPTQSARPTYSKKRDKVFQNSIFIHHFRTKARRGRRKGKEKRRGEDREEKLRFTRNFHGVERVTGIVAGVR